MRPYNPIISVLPFPSAASVGIWFPVPGYLNTSTKYSVHMFCWLDNFTSYICLSVCSLQHAEDTLCPMPWLCFCNSIRHALNDLMKKKPGLASRMRDSRYPMWLPLPHSSRVWRKMLRLSWYSCSSLSSCPYFLARWRFSCFSSVSSASMSVATVGSLLGSFFFFLLFSSLS